jgi:hypothetical protein
MELEEDFALASISPSVTGGLRSDGFDRVQTGVDHLGAQWTSHASPDHQHSGAVHQGPQRKHEASVFARSSAQALRQTKAHQIEGGPWFVQGWGLRESVEEDFIGMAMLEGKFQITLTGLGERSGAAERREEFHAGAEAHRAKDVVAVAVTLVQGRGRGAGRLGDAAHRKSFLAAPGPQPAGGVKDALFELRVCLSGQRPPPYLQDYRLAQLL